MKFIFDAKLLTLQELYDFMRYFEELDISYPNLIYHCDANNKHLSHIEFNTQGTDFIVEEICSPEGFDDFILGGRERRESLLYKGHQCAQNYFSGYGNMLSTVNPDVLAEIIPKGQGACENNCKYVQKWILEAGQGDLIAHYNLGLVYERQGKPYKAIKYFQVAADQGNAPAQYSIGHIYRHSNKMPRNLKEAARHFLLAAKKGHTGALDQLHSICEELNEEENVLYLKLLEKDRIKIENGTDGRYESAHGTLSPKFFPNEHKRIKMNTAEESVIMKSSCQIM